MTNAEDEHRKEIDTTIDILETHVNTCSKAAFDDALILGRYFSYLRIKDLDRIYAIADKFYTKCVCTRK